MRDSGATQTLVWANSDALFARISWGDGFVKPFAQETDTDGFVETDTDGYETDISSTASVEHGDTALVEPSWVRCCRSYE